MSEEVELPRTKALLKRLEPELALIESLLGPVGAIAEYVKVRMMRTLGAADDESNGQLHEMLERALVDEAFADLLVDALDAARHARLEVKIRALGRAIANGYLATDDAEIDDERIILHALAQLEPPHIRVLERLAGEMTEPDKGILRSQRVQDAGPLGDPLISTLESLGLVETAGLYGGPGINGLSTFGKRVREYLLDRADEAH